MAVRPQIWTKTSLNQLAVHIRRPENMAEMKQVCRDSKFLVNVAHVWSIDTGSGLRPEELKPLFKFKGSLTFISNTGHGALSKDLKKYVLESIWFKCICVNPTTSCVSCSYYD